MAPPVSKTQTPNNGQPSPPSTESSAQAARVVSFDCFSTKEGKEDESLRAWKGGGPSGAAWNIDGAPLVCKMTLEAPCSGRTELQLFGNKAALGKTVFNVSTGTNKTEIEVPTRLWERAAESGKLNFSTLLIAAGGVLDCAEDPNETYPFADAFNAGMAVGE